jgi:putative pyruvate formate lyase activating enzyme
LNHSNKDIYSEYNESEIKYLTDCTMCPRSCGVNRFLDLGFCNCDASFSISAVCVHHGEEPVISGKKGICNIFFPHCNLQCIYCQNYEISQNNSSLPQPMSFDKLINKICAVLDKTENIVGFVSPSHYIPQMLAIIKGIKAKGRNPIFVYNSNAYDKPETIKLLEGIIDVYLPDFKYFNSDTSHEYSLAKDYPVYAKASIKEMYRQKGSTLIINDKGIAESGLIIRHLVLPGLAEQSCEILKYISDEISPNIHISLMSQYYPTLLVKKHKLLNRTITEYEYEMVKDCFHNCGFSKGWIQDMDSYKSYRPDFTDKNPFQ